MPDDSDTVVGRLLYQLNGAKEAALLACGTALKKKKKDLENDYNNQQALVGLMSNILMDLYVLDSVLGVLVKCPSEKNELLSRHIFAATLPRIELNAKNVLAICCEGDERRMMLSAVRKLLKYEPENILELDAGIMETF